MSVCAEETRERRVDPGELAETARLESTMAMVTRI